MNYIVSYPPNTKDATATIHRLTVTVTCPHCNEIHHHPKASLFMTYVKATCGKGFYVLQLRKDGTP